MPPGQIHLNEEEQKGLHVPGDWRAQKGKRKKEKKEKKIARQKAMLSASLPPAFSFFSNPALFHKFYCHPDTN